MDRSADWLINHRSSTSLSSAMDYFCGSFAVSSLHFYGHRHRKLYIFPIIILREWDRVEIVYRNVLFLLSMMAQRIDRNSLSLHLYLYLFMWWSSVRQVAVQTIWRQTILRILAFVFLPPIGSEWGLSGGPLRIRSSGFEFIRILCARSAQSRKANFCKSCWISSIVYRHMWGNSPPVWCNFRKWV